MLILRLFVLVYEGQHTGVQIKVVVRRSCG
jgi:hypothetical protein